MYAYSKGSMLTTLYHHYIVAEAQNIAGELYGPNSRCFLQGGPWMLTLGSSIITARDYGGGCYEVCIYIITFV